MSRSLYYVRHVLGRAESVLCALQAVEKDFVRLEGNVNYQKVKTHCENVVEKLKEEARLLPIGFRYTGKFYLKRPYTNPVEFEEVEGSAYQREDLVSWTIEGDRERGQFYHRAVFKEPNLNSEISRLDAEPVILGEDNKC